MVIHIHKEEGKVGDQRTLDQCCAWLPNGEYVVTIETRAQWLKKQPRKKFFAYRFGEGKFTPSGEPYHESVETSKLNKKQMTEYMNKIQAYMLAECGVRVPLPDDEKFKEFQAEYD